jgi:hypothetical protein
MGARVAQWVRSYNTERDIPWSITLIVVMSRRVMGIKIFNSCRWSGGNKTPGVNPVIKCRFTGKHFRKLLSTLPNYAELEQILLFNVNWGKQVCYFDWLCKLEKHTVYTYQISTLVTCIYWRWGPGWLNELGHTIQKGTYRDQSPPIFSRYM